LIIFDSEKNRNQVFMSLTMSLLKFVGFRSSVMSDTIKISYQTMKYTSARRGTTVTSQEIHEAIIHLRYPKPKLRERNQRVFTYAQIAAVVGKSVSYCRQVAIKYRAQMMQDPQAPRTKTRKGWRLQKAIAEKPTTLNEHHVGWLVSDETLKAQIGMSLDLRVASFMNRFPGKKISATTLWHLYFKHRVRRKKIRVTKLANTRLRRRIEKQSQHMAEQLEEMRSRGFRLIFVDETMVTKSTMPTHEWSSVNNNYKVDLSQYGNNSIAVLAGVS
jgi:hypothetical protein